MDWTVHLILVEKPFEYMAGADYRFVAPSDPERFGDFPAVTNGHTD